jgi:hypothetical protein
MLTKGGFHQRRKGSKDAKKKTMDAKVDALISFPVFFASLPPLRLCVKTAFASVDVRDL